MDYQKLLQWVKENKGMNHPIEEIWDIVKLYKLNKNFHYFNAVLLYHSQSPILKEAIDEWIYDKKPTDISDKCICTHHIEQNYHIINKINNHRLIIGSDCINKFLNDNVKKLHKLNLKIDNHQGVTRLCQCCCNFKISGDKEDYIKFCKSCFYPGIKPSELFNEYKNLGNHDQYRFCIICKKYNIKIDVPTWKTKCIQCYHK